MKKTFDDITKIVTSPAGLVIVGAIVLTVGIVVLHNTVTAVTGAALGTSPAQDSHNLDGTPQDAYSGKGAIGTLGAFFNNLSGGSLSSFGQWIGDNLPISSP